MRFGTEEVAVELTRRVARSFLPHPLRLSAATLQVLTGLGLGLIAQTCSDLVVHFLSRAILFRRGKATRSCGHSGFVTRPDCRYKSHQINFLGDFHSCSLPEIVQDTRCELGV
jgi:hypothetical protein